MAGPPPFARLFTAAPEGQNEDNGALLELVLCALPPDKIQTAAAAARPLAAMASLAVPPEACGLPIMPYLDAVKGGHLPVLRWYWASAPPRSDTAGVLASHGHLAALQWAHEVGCPMPVDICGLAALHGQLGVLQWARSLEPPYPGIDRVCILAANNGYLAVLQWARAQDPPFPWSHLVCDRAARNGHLAVLQWACVQDPPCPWSPMAIRLAARNGHLEVLAWLRACGCPE